jgi:acyl-CoA oxidase
MAYESAVAAGVHPLLVKLYEIGVVGYDASWYIGNAGMS